MEDKDVCIDALGVAHRKADAGARIVSLVPSITELLCDLGLADQLVGRTGFCIHPRETVKGIAKLGGTKDVDIEKLRELAPTHVIVNVDENRREIIEPLSGFVDHIFVTHPLAPQDNLVLYESLGFLFSVEQRAAKIAQAYRDALARIEAISDLPRLRVLYLIWRDPWMTVAPDTYISRMLKLVNWDSVPQTAADRYPAIELGDYVASVDKVLLSSEPYPFRDKHVAEIRAIVGEAVEVSLVDGEMLSWYGSRAIAGLEYLRRLAKPLNQEAVA